MRTSALIFPFNQLLKVTAFAGLLALAAAHPAWASVFYDSTGGAENGGDPLSPSGAGPTLADRFVAPSNATLSSVSLNLSLPSGVAPGQGFNVDLFSDSGSTGPGPVLLQIASVQDTSLTPGGFSLVTFTPTSLFDLTGGQSYYIGVMDNGSNAVLGNTLDPTVLARPWVIAGATYFNNGGVQANAGGPYEIIVNATATPEPSVWVLALAGLGFLMFIQRRAVKQN